IEADTLAARTAATRSQKSQIPKAQFARKDRHALTNEATQTHSLVAKRYFRAARNTRIEKPKLSTVDMPASTIITPPNQFPATAVPTNQNATATSSPA